MTLCIVIGWQGSNGTLQVASTQTDRYSDPKFITSMAYSQSRLRIITRDFWNNLHEGLLDSWTARAAAAMIHAFGQVHMIYAAAEEFEHRRKLQPASASETVAADASVGKPDAPQTPESTEADEGMVSVESGETPFTRAYRQFV
jgi:hypothetical protein